MNFNVRAIEQNRKLMHLFLENVILSKEEIQGK